MTTVEATEMSLAEAAGAIREKRLSSVEATKACLARIDALGARLNSFLSLEREEALRAAEAADADLARGKVRGPLHGVPLAHKDMYYRKGRVSTCGSKIMRDYVQEATSTVLARLAGAGALYLGGLNMSEFAAGPTGHNEHYGDCHNPWNTAHITGGSSSGSGASVAARLVYGAMGSDTGGSVRLPAALCGVVGLKPTYGRISRFGTMPRAWTLDTIGPLTRTVRDCALMTSVIAGADPDDPTTPRVPVPDYAAAMDAGVSGRKVGVPKNHFYKNMTEEIGAALEASLKVLEGQGARIAEVSLPDMTPLYRLGDVISKCESATLHAKWMRSRPQDYGRHILSRVDAGFHIPATRYLEALSVRRSYLEEFMAAVFEKVDVLHAPVIPMPVPTLEETSHSGSAAVPGLVASMTRLTRPINYLGVPALSVPCGFSRSGLPISFQLIGRPFAEADLFAVADAYQRATEWHSTAPKL